ncbi:5517_t:CDS:2, partial [Racocetra persica]
SSDEEISKRQQISNKHLRNTIHENVSLNNSVLIPAYNIAWSIHQSQDFYNHNDYLSSYASRSRSSYNLDPELIHNSDYIPSNIPIQSNFINQNLTYDTYSSSKNANRLQVPFNGTNNSEDRFVISRNAIMPEQQCSLSRATTMSLDDVLDLHLTYQDSSLQQNSYNHYKENDLMTNLQSQ